MEEQQIEEDYRNLGDKSSDTRSRIRDGLLGCTPETGLHGSELSSFLREVRFSNQEFAAGTPVSNIQYNDLGFQNNNLFYLCHNQLDYGLVKYFVESKTTKNNVEMFLSKPLIAPLTEKLSY